MISTKKKSFKISIWFLLPYTVWRLTFEFGSIKVVCICFWCRINRIDRMDKWKFPKETFTFIHERSSCWDDQTQVIWNSYLVQLHKSWWLYGCHTKIISITWGKVNDQSRIQDQKTKGKGRQQKLIFGTLPLKGRKEGFDALLGEEVEGTWNNEVKRFLRLATINNTEKLIHRVFNMHIIHINIKTKITERTPLNFTCHLCWVFATRGWWTALES